MGTSNIAAVYLYWGHLESSEFRLLTHMALLSIDPPGAGDMAPCLYWGNVESQVSAMNYSGKNAARKLRRLRAGLVEAGAIELVRHSARGRSPTWRLITDLGAQDRQRPALPWLGGPPRP
jgi:hypothetical protein